MREDIKGGEAAARRLAEGATLPDVLDAGDPMATPLLDAHGGAPRLRAGVALLDDPDVRLRVRAAQSVRSWAPGPDVPRGSVEVGELLGRARHVLGESALRMLMWEAGINR